FEDSGYFSIKRQGRTNLLSGLALDSTDLLTVRASGEVGIGTTAPDRKLDIRGTTNPQLRLTHTAGTVYTDFQTLSGGNLLITPSSGLVGIGAVSAGKTLNVQATGNALAQTYTATGSVSGWVSEKGDGSALALTAGG